MPYNDSLLSTPDDNPMISGPFLSQTQMSDAILMVLGRREPQHYVRLLQGMIDRTLKDHNIVFAHGNL